MLKKLSIRHFAIIDELDLEFQGGFNILSGETGAGKSIIIQAIGLILGERGYSDLIRSGEDECEVVAEFERKEGPQVIRRVLQRSGKGKVWVDQETRTVGDLQMLGRSLIELVSQHESQNLLADQMPQVFLDAFGKHEKILQDYRQVYQAYLSIRSERDNLEAKAKEALEKEDLYRFQLQEIREAALKKDEETELGKERNILTHSAKISETVGTVETLLYSGNDSVTELLGRAESSLSRISGIDPEIDQKTAALDSLVAELAELSRFFQTYLSRLEFDPQRLEQIEERLDQISKLKKKHGGDLEAIFHKAEELEKAIGLLDHFDEVLKEIVSKYEQAEKTVAKKASDLTSLRKKAARELSQSMEKELGSLAMGKTKFEVRIGPLRQDSLSSKFGPGGADQVEFFISPNVGEEPKPLALIASGGELSRILLALKGILRSPDSAKTYIFDEVDSGIGGATAEVVGQKLKALSQNAQVICITHLPQIAACADAHYQIVKQEKKERVTTRVRRLMGEEREEEIARMLAGVKVTEKARSHARELIGQLGETSRK
jgi:DNA repair protein RecN (Recombination protein N)